jgi:hypothetical protein
MKLLYFRGPVDTDEALVIVEDDVPESEYPDYAPSGWELKFVGGIDPIKGDEMGLPTEYMMRREG